MAFKFEVEKHLAPLQDEYSSDGFRLELNLVSFNDRKAKYDIRPWDEHHENMKKGISLTKEQAAKLRDALNAADL